MNIKRATALALSLSLLLGAAAQLGIFMTFAGCWLRWPAVPPGRTTPWYPKRPSRSSQRRTPKGTR